MITRRALHRFLLGPRSRSGILAFMMVALLLPTGIALGQQPQTSPAAKPAQQRLGFYLHACWTYDYPFAVRAWQR
jgi:hypothetical protein